MGSNKKTPFLMWRRSVIITEEVILSGVILTLIILITKQLKRWYDFDSLLVSAFLIASGVVITLCFGNLETVPFSKRTHVVLFSRSVEKYLGNCVFELMKEEYEGKILAPDHPNIVRVQRISQALIEAVKKELSSDDGILVDDWGNMVKKGKTKKNKLGLENFEWEVIVVDKPVKKAGCLLDGKIVVFTGLSKFEDDAEVAISIGREVGHAVARHTAEHLLKKLWSIIVKIIIWQCLDPTLSSNISDILFIFFVILAGFISDFLFSIFVTLPFSRRNELEADYIGMLLAASAGYDPRVAPKMYEKLGRRKDGFLNTHPSGKKRAEKLSQAEVMGKALSIFRQAQEEQAIP